MIRTVIGGLVAGIILFVMGFIFWAPRSSEIAFSKAGDAQAAAVQTSLALNLTKSGTGTYQSPTPARRRGRPCTRKARSRRSPTTRPASPQDMGTLVPGFILAVATGLLMAFGLAAFGGGGRSFAEGQASRPLRSGFTTCGESCRVIFAHYGWEYWIYAARRGRPSRSSCPAW